LPRSEVQRQSVVLAESQQRAAEQVLQDGFPGEPQALVGQFQNHERMAGIAIYGADGQPLAITPGLADRLSRTPPAVARAARGTRKRRVLPVACSASGQPPPEEIFRPLIREMASLAISLHVARAAAEQEARRRDAASSQWTAGRLRISMQGKLKGRRLFAVSNREPYETLASRLAVLQCGLAGETACPTTLTSAVVVSVPSSQPDRSGARSLSMWGTCRRKDRTSR
jgi:hypothetical protein